MKLWDKSADVITRWFGSIVFTIAVILGFGYWMSNSDNLLIPNIILSILAIVMSSIILMSQRRMSDIDRQRSIEDHEINKRLEAKIDSLQKQVKDLESTVIFK